MTKRNKVPLQVSVQLRYLYDDKGLHGKELIKMYPKLSKATIYQHTTKSIEENSFTRQKTSKQREIPRVLSERDRRAILRQIPILQKS